MSSKYGQISSLIYSNKGRFCSVTFIKKDGTTRKMSIQPASITSRLVGDAASDSAKQATETRKANNPNLLPVFDAQKKEIRSINMDTIISIKANGVTYKFEE